MQVGPPSSELFDVLAAADEGRLHAAENLMARWRDDGGRSAACAALAAVRFLAGLEASPPSPAAVSSRGEAPAVVAEAWLRLALVHVVRLDAVELGRAVEAARAARSERPDHRLRADAYDLWAALARGQDEADAVEVARSIEGEASKRELATLVIEVASFRALCLVSRGDVVEATRVARRAARMSATERLPQQQYLANVVLARVRRAAGRPHLALRILSALQGIAPEPWHEWIDWELALSGGGPESPDARAGALLAMAQAARDGDRQRFGEMSERIREAPRFAFVRQDVDRLVAALDPACKHCPPDVAEWRAGVTDRPPHGLEASAHGDQGPEGTGPLAHVVLLPDGRATRFLSPGLGLLGGEHRRQPTGKRRAGRVQVALPALALAAETGIAEPDLFARVWGFNYVKELHQNTLGLLVHRIRGELVEGVRLVREHGRLRLETETPLVIADARCGRAVEDRLLHLLGRRQGANAREAARELGISLRGAQAALEALVSDGECQRTGAGPSTSYVVEDTTFHEPTRH